MKKKNLSQYTCHLLRLTSGHTFWCCLVITQFLSPRVIALSLVSSYLTWAKRRKKINGFVKSHSFASLLPWVEENSATFFPKSFSFRYFSHPYGNLLFWKIMVYLGCEACQEWMYTGYWCTIHAFIPCAYIIVWWASTTFAITVFMSMLRWPSLLFWSWHNNIGKDWNNSSNWNFLFNNSAL